MNIKPAKNRISEKDLSVYENTIGEKFGEQLKKYTLEYGCIHYKTMELYGINTVTRDNSSMIRQSKYLHKDFPETKGMAPLENLGEGFYALVDPKDKVWYYDIEQRSLKDSGFNLFDYINVRINEEDSID